MSGAPEGLREKIARLRAEGLRDLEQAADRAALEAIVVRDLARKGRLADLFGALARADAAERPGLGQLLNELKQELLAAQAAAEAHLAAATPRRRASEDPTLPGRPCWHARLHVLTQVLEEMKSIFKGLGFRVVTGPEVELDHYNFEALNFPPNHPARDLQDTFYISDSVLLRTQTSPMQVRIMEQSTPPVRVIVPGRVYRNEQLDASHAAEFHQVEGLYVDRHVSMVDLKATITYFVRQLFGGESRIRFKPHFFPFTEPSVDVDMSCFACRGAGCGLCGKSGWIEIMGAGMVHPNVFAASGYDPEAYTGFAFGIGVDRVAMLRHGIGDIRLLLENDGRFLAQF
jgi:phenylalanyl-tRNA synthetase alpha chain